MSANQARRRCAIGNAFVLIVLCLSFRSFTSTAAEPVDELFKRALFDEEGRRDYEAAIRGYEEVVRAMDEQRRLAATAVFRLGECYRKLGRTNDAVAQFQRVIREFSGEETLVTLSQQNVLALGGSDKSETGSMSEPLYGAGAGRAQDGQSSLHREITELSAAIEAIEAEADNPEAQARIILAVFPEPDLTPNLRQMLLQLLRIREQVERFRADTNLPSGGVIVPRFFRAIGSGAGPEIIGASVVQGLADPLAEAEKELAKQVKYLRDRVEFTLGVQKARLDVLRRQVSGVDQTAALAKQLEAIEAIEDPYRRATALRTLFAIDARGIASLQERVVGQEHRLAELSVKLGEGHPDVRQVTAGLEVLRKKLEQEVGDVLAAQRARLEALRTASAERGDRGSSYGVSDSDTSPMTSEEAEEIRRIKALVANSPDLINAGPTTPLQLAAGKGQLAVATYLLDHGARVDSAAGTDSALHTATQAGHKAMVELLLERGASVNARGNRGRTPLHVAARMGFVAIAKVLLANGADVHALSEGSPPGQAPERVAGTPLQEAVEANHLEMAQLLLEHGTDPNRRAEGHIAPISSANSPEMIRLLVSKGADLNADGGVGLLSAVNLGAFERAKALLEAGAKPDPVAVGDGLSKMSPLVRAVLKTDRAMANLLLRHGADINRMIEWRGEGRAAIHFLAEGDDHQWLQWALENGANPNLPTGGNLLPLELTRVARLTSDDLDRNEKESASRWHKALVLLRHGADPNLPLTSINGGTMAHVAARSGDRKAFSVLIERNADLNAKGRYGITPLMIALASDNFEAVEALLKAGVDVNARAEDGWTALHVLAFQTPPRAAEFARRLLAADADPSLENEGGDTAAEIAVSGQRLPDLPGTLDSVVDPKASGRSILRLWMGVALPPRPVRPMPPGGEPSDLQRELVKVFQRQG